MDPTPETRKPLPESVQAELAALAEKSDEDIDFSDIPETKDEDWVGAVRGKFYRPVTHSTHNDGFGQTYPDGNNS